MEKKIDGYIKLIKHTTDEKNRDFYSFYVENEDSQLYTINVNFNKSKVTGDISELETKLEPVSVSKINSVGDFYVPREVEDFSISESDLDTTKNIRGCEIGSILEFNKNFAIVFNNQMSTVKSERIYDILGLNKDNFVELVDTLRNMSLQEVSLKNQFEEVIIDAEFEPDIQKIREGKPRTLDNGVFAEYDLR